MPYSADDAAIFSRAAPYVKKILKGTNPADLPIEQPTKFELVINLKTAKQIDDSTQRAGAGEQSHSIGVRRKCLGGSRPLK